jgi:tRNA (cytidine/uridine-2'-O-)-methyltransferase
LKERRDALTRRSYYFVCSLSNRYQELASQHDNYFSMISVALVEPEIPQNTGNIARLCAATNTSLHIVGMPGFRLDDRAVRRAGLDYWPEVALTQHRDLAAMQHALADARLVYFTTKAELPYFNWKFEKNDCLVFGRETRGLPESLLRSNWDRCVTIPMLNPKIRSLNLSSAVAIVLYQALNQTGCFASWRRPREKIT